MSFFDKVAAAAKGATGLGLNPEESYHRAYEKGVLLGKYDAASEMFGKAAEKYDEAGRPADAHRARANQYLYAFVATKDIAHIDKILPHLKALAEIEELGSETEKISAPELAAELEARRLESQAFAVKSHLSQAQALHSQAAGKFQEILKAKLKTYKAVPAADHNDTAEERFFLHQGYTFYHQAGAAQDADPVEAVDKLSQAALAFKRAKDEGLRAKMDAVLSNLRVKRTCWFCHREMQGLGLNVEYYPARITRYGRQLVEKLGQDVTTVDPEGRSVAVCLSCATMVQSQADAYATAHVQALRNELVPQINDLISGVNNLAERVKELERVAHRH